MAGGSVTTVSAEHYKSIEGELGHTESSPISHFLASQFQIVSVGARDARSCNAGGACTTGNKVRRTSAPVARRCKHHRRSGTERARNNAEEVTAQAQGPNAPRACYPFSL